MGEPTVMREELLAYLATLDEDVQKLYFMANVMVLTIRDTSSEEFQIAAAVLDVFRDRVLQRKE